MRALRELWIYRPIFTARIRRMGEGNSFSLLDCPQGEGVPTLARLGRRKRVSQGRYPLPPGQVRMGDGGVPQSRYDPLKVCTPPPPGQDGGRSTPKVGTPPPCKVGTPPHWILVSLYPVEGRYPFPIKGRYPSPLKLGTPPPSKAGIPPLHQVTCYTAGGMPLVFTQEDFLVP